MESQVMRLPRYARGLKLVRLGVFLMLLQLALSIVVTIKSLTASDGADNLDAFQWIKYLFWTNIGASSAMLLGTLYAIPDFRIARMSIHLVLLAAIGFAVTTGAQVWSYQVLTAVLDTATDPATTLADVNVVAERLKSLPIAAVIKDVAYTIALIAAVRSIRQTAVVYEHDALRDAAGTVSRLVAVMLAADVVYQLTYGFGSVGISFALLGLAFAIGVLVYWVYCHLRLAKFLRAAAYLVNEPHEFPTATIVSAAATAPAQAPKAPPRPSAPVVVRSTPSAPVIVPPTELRIAPTPRAETAPGEPPPEQPTFLR